MKSATDTLTVTEAAALKGVAEQSIYNAIARGAFPNAIKEGSKYRGTWYLPRAEVEAWQPRNYPRKGRETEGQDER